MHSLYQLIDEMISLKEVFQLVLRSVIGRIDRGNAVFCYGLLLELNELFIALYN